MAYGVIAHFEYGLSGTKLCMQLCMQAANASKVSTPLPGTSVVKNLSKKKHFNNCKYMHNSNQWNINQVYEKRKTKLKIRTSIHVFIGN